MRNDVFSVVSRRVGGVGSSELASEQEEALLLGGPGGGQGCERKAAKTMGSSPAETGRQMKTKDARWGALRCRRSVDPTLGHHLRNRWYARQARQFCQDEAGWVVQVSAGRGTQRCVLIFILFHIYSWFFIGLFRGSWRLASYITRRPLCNGADWVDVGCRFPCIGLGWLAHLTRVGTWRCMRFAVAPWDGMARRHVAW